MSLLNRMAACAKPALKRLPRSLKLFAGRSGGGGGVISSEYLDALLAQEAADTWRSFTGKADYLITCIPPSASVLDIGCDVGLLLQQLRQARPAAQLTGTETSAEAVACLAEQGIKGVMGGFPRLPLPDKAFNVVMAAKALTHSGQPEAAIRETIRLCHPAGLVIFTVPDNCLGSQEQERHLRQYTRDSLWEVLNPYFEDILIESVPDAETHFLIARCRLPKAGRG